MTPRWDTLTTRFIIVVTAALIISKILSAVLIQLDIERIVAWSARASQSAKASHWVTALDTAEAFPFDQWASPEPALKASEFDADLSASLSERAGLEVHAGWREILTTPSMGGEPSVSTITTVFKVLVVSLRGEDGVWRNAAITPRLSVWPPPLPMLISLFASLLTIVIAAVMVGTRIAKPFRALAIGADRLASGKSHEPLAVWGPTDVRRAQTAFNAMASRVQATLSAQRDLLSAIGHDLRTPLTALRVRAEMIEPDEERERFMRSLDELERLMESALAAGQGLITDTPKTRVDMLALLDAVSADFADMGAPVTMAPGANSAVIEGWPDALRRAVRNLVDNAVRYGGSAVVRLENAQDALTIIVDDNGPGVPAAHLTRMKEPLVRLDPSRTASGGHGLGLSITQSIAEAHGGDLRLENRREGGLRARLTLPLAA